jgi:hypothetical protein
VIAGDTCRAHSAHCLCPRWREQLFPSPHFRRRGFIDRIEEPSIRLQNRTKPTEREVVAVLAGRVAELRFEERFCGPPRSANGGYACGSIAELLGGEVEVTPRRPPPLDRPLRLRVADGAAMVHDGVNLVAEARPATVGLGVPGGISMAEAQAAADRYPLFQGIHFPPASPAAPTAPRGMGCGSSQDAVSR